MQAVYDVLAWINSNILWGIPLIVLLIALGVFLSIRTKFLQVRKFGYSIKGTLGDSIKQMKKDKKSNSKHTISPFEAFSTAVSGTVGTGNIVGATTAILSGGPGAVFWMWISAFFGCITKYSEITLGVYYRKKDQKGEYFGGPMYYIEKGTKQKWLAILFAIFTILASIGMSSVQADTIQATWNSAFGIPTWATAIIIAVLTALVVIGGIKRIGKVASILVPFMAIIFILLAIILILVNVTAVPAAIASIFTSAFTPNSMIGGFMGYGIAQAMRFGFARGIFSNEAGLGSSPIAHANSEQIEPVKQGLWGIFEVFLDTFVICTLTALFILTSGIDGTGAKAANVAMTSFTNVFSTFGMIAYSIILPLFAFTTILAWAVYGGKCTQYIFNKHPEIAKLVYNITYVLMIVAIALLTFFNADNLGADFVWLISDMTNALMAIPNLIGLLILSGQIVKITKNYFDRKKGLNVKPMLSFYEDVNEQLSQELSEEESQSE